MLYYATLYYAMLHCQSEGIILYDTTSKSRSAVDREFMYIGSAGPGRADGRTAGARPRPGGRAGGWAGGRDDFERQYNDFHRFSQIIPA